MFVISSKPVQDCTIFVPGSKSYTHRVLIAAALADGRSRIVNALRSEDTELTIAALRQMGVPIGGTTEEVEVMGLGGSFLPTTDPIYLGNSGTSMRLLISMAALGQGDYLFTGSPRMQERPVQALIDSLAQIDVPVCAINNDGCPPLIITGGIVEGGEVAIDCSVSSQFLSSLLLMAPLTRKGLSVDVSKGPVSKPYIDLTIDIMQKFGVRVDREGYERFRVTGKQHYLSGTYSVEPDVSNASYFWAAGAISGQAVKVHGVRDDSLQGDTHILHLFEEMGCQVTKETDGITVRGGELKPIETDMGDMPDMVPTMAVVAAYAEGTSCIRNVSHLKAKECDRLAAVINELNAMGINAYSSGENLCIQGGQPAAAEIETYNDHRIAMSFAVAGLRAPGTRIRNPACVEKSFPSFWQVFETLQKPSQ
jgi:3-phosphoshikimate 1-carboxyvinyltransferase